MKNSLRSAFLRVVGSFSRLGVGVHIVNSHYITPKKLNPTSDYRVLEEYLQYLNLSARIVDVEVATARILEKNIPTDEILISFTFDDGFEECYTIIALLVEKYNCRGAFFINANNS